VSGAAAVNRGGGKGGDMRGREDEGFERRRRREERKGTR
jgi:hypothetical protein